MRFGYHHGTGDGPAYDWLPDRPIVNELVAPSQLLAVPDAAVDNGVTIRVYGWDTDGRRILDPMDKQDGFVVTANTSPTLAAPIVARIERVSKSPSKGYVKLFAGSTTGTLLGDYGPNELEPMYRRLRINRRCAGVRIAFRKADQRITSLSDVINLRSKPAIVNAVKALSVRLDNPAQYAALMKQAVEMLQAEQAQRDQTMPPRQPEQIGGGWETSQVWDGIY